MGTSSRWLTRRGPDRSRLGLVVGMVVLALLVLLDVLLTRNIFVSTFLLAPLATSLLSNTRQTAIVAGAALLAAAVSPIWDQNFASAGYLVRLVVASAGGVLAMATALGRATTRTNVERLELLAEVSRIIEESLPLAETIDRINGVLVPPLADISIVDVAQDHELVRIAVRASGPRARELEPAIRARAPSSASALGSGRAVQTGEAVLLERIGDADLAAMAQDEDDLALLRSVDPKSAVILPLRARGRVLGGLTLITAHSGRRYGTGDLRFCQALSERIALALDGAGLVSELAGVQERLTAVMANLAEAVTVEDHAGRIIYANQAAAALFGCDSVEELLATAPEEIAARFDAYAEDGSRLDAKQLPGRRVLRGERADPVMARMVDRVSGEERWRVTKSTSVNDARGDPLFAVNVIEDVTDVKRAEESERLLAEAGRVLASSVDYEQTLQGVANLAVPGFADWCSVSVPRPDGLIEQVALAHADPSKVALGQRMRERYPSHVDDPEGAARTIREGTAEIMDVPDELLVELAQDEKHLELLRGLGLRSAMLVPMAAGDQTVGVLAFVQAESGRRFTERDLALGQELGRRAGTAIENARLFRERSAIARDLQAGLRPPRLPEIPGWRVEGHYEAAGEENEVGGDFYDAFEIPGGWMLVVGDVAGRGAKAAALTSLARYTIRTAGKLVGDPLMALAHLNRSLHDRGEHGALCSAALLVLREEGTKALATVVCAGHPLPFLIRDGVPAQVGEFGTFLGAFLRERWTPVELVLDPGDQLLLYTDGVLDARGEDDRFGESRLAEAIAGAKTSGETIRRVEHALREFEADTRRDDVALLAAMRVSAGELHPEPEEDHAASLAGVGQSGRALDGLDEEAVRRAASA